MKHWQTFDDQLNLTVRFEFADYSTDSGRAAWGICASSFSIQHILGAEHAPAVAVPERTGNRRIGLMASDLVVRPNSDSHLGTLASRVRRTRGDSHSDRVGPTARHTCRTTRRPGRTLRPAARGPGNVSADRYAQPVHDARGGCGRPGPDQYPAELREHLRPAAIGPAAGHGDV